MKKKPSSGSLYRIRDQTVLNWRNVPERDLLLYARSFHTSAKKLAGTLGHGSGPSPASTLARSSSCTAAPSNCTKTAVPGDGGNFLSTKPDALSVHKTHSVSWLAQFVCQIVTALKWESEFRCEGIENLADFKAVDMRSEAEAIETGRTGGNLRPPNQ